SGGRLVGLARLTLLSLTDSCTLPGGVQIPFPPGGGPRLTRPSGKCGVGLAGGGGGPPRRWAIGETDSVKNAKAAKTAQEKKRFAFLVAVGSIIVRSGRRSTRRPASCRRPSSRSARWRACCRRATG